MAFPPQLMQNIHQKHPKHVVFRDIFRKKSAIFDELHLDVCFSEK
jgi:hypothetical protein